MIALGTFCFKHLIYNIHRCLCNKSTWHARETSTWESLLTILSLSERIKEMGCDMKGTAWDYSQHALQRHLKGLNSPWHYHALDAFLSSCWFWLGSSECQFVSSFTLTSWNQRCSSGEIQYGKQTNKPIQEGKFWLRIPYVRTTKAEIQWQHWKKMKGTLLKRLERWRA